MAAAKSIWQGIGFIVFGAFFSILSSVLYVLNYIKTSHLVIFIGLSVVLAVLGVVVIVVSMRVPKEPAKKKQRKK